MSGDFGEGRTLVSRTRRLDHDLDLLDVCGESGLLWARGRTGVAGRGVAARIAVPRHDPVTAAKATHDALDRIDVDDEVGLPGCGPVAFGAFPFAPERDGEMVVPELIVGRAEDGTRWLTTVGPIDVPLEVETTVAHLQATLSPPMEGAGNMEASAYVVASSLDPAEWCAAVAAARDDLRSGSAQKVVLARGIEIVADRPLGITSILRRLRTTYPSCMIYAVDGFVGASPELLVARSGDTVRSHPMAGTAPRSNDSNTDARLAAGLLASAKDRVEHRYTIDMVHDTLLPWCSYLDEEAEPSIVAMANVQHLATLVEGRLSAPPASVMELMVALHPTPAVGGAPRASALAMIDRLEHLDRGRYAGPVGWVDAAGNGEWAVGIRGAEVDGPRAKVVAGVGVVADSDPETELAETRAKLQAMLSAIVRP